VFKKASFSKFEFTDLEEPERVRRSLVLDRKLESILKKKAPTKNEFRYWWTLSSESFVDTELIESHLHWILSNLRTGKLLSDLSAHQINYFVSCFWHGNGTGGGPLLSVDFIDTLQKQKTAFAVSFYSY
jgi:hypothetical protein